MPHEKMLHQALYSDYVSYIPSVLLKEVNAIYNDEYKVKHIINASCAACIMKPLKKLGMDFFNEKLLRFNNERTPILPPKTRVVKRK